MLVLAFALCAQGTQDPLAAVQAAEERRVAVVARCAPAVCSVMAMDAPGGGSGVIIDPTGFVLTNYHVVGEPEKDHEQPAPPAPAAEQLAALRRERADLAGASEPQLLAAWQTAWREEHHARGVQHYRNKKVGLPDGQLYEAVVLGIDPGSDLAVLRLLPKRDGQTWPHCRLGDSDQLLVGETVFAMGNPFLLATDFTPTVTFGIVSATHRYQEGQGQRILVYPDCIQVDAPVNPGNSGGPLFNEAGEVVGINGRISVGDRGRVNVGVGFAIASNQIRNFLGDLLAGRHAEHGTLDMSAWFMASTDGSKRRGVYVQQVYRDSVVAAAGIALGDEITRFDGTEVRSANQLATLVGVLPAGAWVTLAYRPSTGEGAFGDERLLTLKLARLDTGSSRDGAGADARLASRKDRRLATRALLASLPAIAPATDEEAAAVHWQRVAPDGAAVTAIAHGGRLRLELGDLVLVRDAGGGGHAIAGGAARDLTPDETERLRREQVANPVLWPAAAIGERLRDAILVGGTHVHGAPAYRFELPGDGECEVWLFTDGTPAGCVFRDPLRRQKLEWHVRGDKLRVVADGALAAGWSGSVRRTGPVDEAWFRRN